MAILSSDGKSVTVQKGDNLWNIAAKYAGGGSNYKTLAAINGISNPNRIYVGQVIKLTNSAGSGGGSSSSSSSAVNTNKPTITAFGEQSDADDTLFATWSWSKTNTESYKVVWEYDTGNDVWFVGSNSTISVDEHDAALSRQSTYSVPSNAKKVRFKVKPISKKYTKNDKETSYWTANWSDVKTWTNETPLTTPSVPRVEIDKYTLTAELENININKATQIEFQVVKDNSNSVFASGKADIVSTYATFSCTVEAGAEYKVRCRALSGSNNSEWTEYSSNVKSLPATPKAITVYRASSKTSVYLEWEVSNTADTYDIQYATKKTYFDISDQVQSRSGIETTKFDVTGLETGYEYFFRVRANDSESNESSGWSDIVSVSIGKKPAAPTTWSSTTTAITGEDLVLYWVHNSEDGSSQTYGDLEIYIDPVWSESGELVGGFKETHTIQNSTDEDLKDKTSFYTFDTSNYIEGTTIEWRVRTAGVTLEYGDWSIKRTVNIYAPPTLELTVSDTVASFPMDILAIPGPATQTPIGYHLTIKSNETYETVDSIGNEKTVSSGQEVFSRYFDINTSLDIALSAGDIDLENNIEYTLECLVSMNSGLTTKATKIFDVTWTEVEYIPNAEISLDEDSYVTYIRPYCERESLTLYVVEEVDGIYTKTTTPLGSVYGELLPNTVTTTGEKVYAGTTAEGEELYYCEMFTSELVSDITLSLYRKEFDGSFVEIATGLSNENNTTVTDPHPSLDYARYRVVAIANYTGAVSYYDLPPYPVGGIGAVIKWDEEWFNFETSEETSLSEPAWSGQILKLPFNLDISDSVRPDTTLVKYIGRKRPVSYYGTHLGEGSSWNMVIPKEDTETLYLLRRLAIHMGDVYVSESSGSGYWANIQVSFNQKHDDLTIPITISITRVEGGM